MHCSMWAAIMSITSTFGNTQGRDAYKRTDKNGKTENRLDRLHHAPTCKIPWILSDSEAQQQKRGYTIMMPADEPSEHWYVKKSTTHHTCYSSCAHRTRT